MKRIRTPVLITIGIFCFLALAFYHVKSVGKAPIISGSNFDLYHYYLPLMSFAKKSVCEGVFPLWNPFQAVGGPFFATTPCGLLYPINWIILLLDVPTAMLMIQALNIIIGMVGMLLYMRYLKLDWPGVLLATVIFGYLVLLQTFNLAMGSSYCWLPLIVMSAHRLFDKPSFKACAALTAFLTLSFLGGHQQFLFYHCILLSIFLFLMVLFSLPRYGLKSLLFRSGMIGLAFLMMVGVVSVQLLPTMELSLLSVRNLSENYFAGSDPYIFDFSILGTFHGYFDRVQNLNYFGASLLLIPLALSSKKHRPVVIAMLVAVGYSMLFVLSKKVPALALFGQIPFSDAFRFNTRMLDSGHFFVAVLSGIGLCSFWDREPLRVRNMQTGKLDRFWVPIIVSIVLFSYPLGVSIKQAMLLSPVNFMLFQPCLLVAFIIAIHSSKYSRRVKWALASAGTLVVALLCVINRDTLYPNMYLAIFLACLVLAFFLLMNASKYPLPLKKLATWLIGIIVLLDIASARNSVWSIPYINKAPTGKYLFDDRFEWIKENAGFSRVLLADSWLKAKHASMAGLFNISDYEPYTLIRWKHYVRMVVGPEQFDEMVTPGRIFAGWIDTFEPTTVQKQFLRQTQMTGLASLRYFMTRKPMVDDGSGEFENGWNSMNEGASNRTFHIYENTSALPRAYLVNSYIVTHDETESLQAISENIASLSWSVVLENGTPSFPSSDKSTDPGQVVIKKYGANEVELHVDAMEDSLVVLTDSYYPDWNAFVDDVRKPLWRANSLFRAVEVSPGEHTVVFRYQPASVRRGIAISFCSLLLIFAGLLIERHYALDRKAGQTDSQSSDHVAA